MCSIVLLVAAVMPRASAQPRDARVEHLVARVDADTLRHYVRVLTGETPVSLGGEAVTIASRSNTSTGNEQAAAFLRQTLQRFGLTVEDQAYSAVPDRNDLLAFVDHLVAAPYLSPERADQLLARYEVGLSTGRNVLAVQPGTEAGAGVYLIGAHYDSRTASGAEPAPGADDNASGTAAVLEAARLLSTVATRATVVYALWDEEEYGLIGSAYYALRAGMDGAAIRAVLNLDMIAYDHDDDGAAWVLTDSNGAGLPVARFLLDVNNTYGIGLRPALLPCTVGRPFYGCPRTDHIAFWMNGFPAVGLIEHGFGGGDFNPHYHTVDDRPIHFNDGYFRRMVQWSVAALAHLVLVGDETVGLESRTPVTVAPTAVSNYPNPFAGRTTIWYAVSEAGRVRLAVYDVLGREVAVLMDATQPAGVHTASWSVPPGTPGGVYLFRLTTTRHTRTRRMVHAP